MRSRKHTEKVAESRWESGSKEYATARTTHLEQLLAALLCGQRDVNPFFEASAQRLVEVPRVVGR